MNLVNEFKVFALQDYASIQQIRKQIDFKYLWILILLHFHCIFLTAINEVSITKVGNNDIPYPLLTQELCNFMA